MKSEPNQFERVSEWVVKTLITSALILVVMAIAFGFWVFFQDRDRQDAGPSSASPIASPASPEGYASDGIPIGDHTPGARAVAIVTDVSCPICQKFFDENTVGIQDLADSGEVNLYLIPVNIFPDSEINPVALATLQNVVATEDGQELEAYATLSDAAKDADQDLGSFREMVSSGDLAELVATEDELSDPSLLDWTQFHTRFNRDGIGVVPSAIVDGTAVSIDEFTDEFLR